MIDAGLNDGQVVGGDQDGARTPSLRTSFEVLQVLGAGTQGLGSHWDAVKRVTRRLAQLTEGNLNIAHFISLVLITEPFALALGLATGAHALRTSPLASPCRG